MSSKSGNNKRSGLTRDSRLRSCSHCPVKLSTRASARSSAIIRRTCAAKTSGSRKLPCSARSSSSSSGMLQRKNDSRDASSISLIGCVEPAGTSGDSLSARNKNQGLTNIRDSAA